MALHFTNLAGKSNVIWTFWQQSLEFPHDWQTSLRIRNTHKYSNNKLLNISVCDGGWPWLSWRCSSCCPGLPCPPLIPICHPSRLHRCSTPLVPPEMKCNWNNKKTNGFWVTDTFLIFLKVQIYFTWCIQATFIKRHSFHRPLTKKINLILNW